MGDELVDLELLSHDFLNELRDLSSTLPATKCCSFPFSSGDELEWSSGNFMTCSCNSNDAALSPASMSKLEGLSHHNSVSGTIISVVVPPFLVTLHHLSLAFIVAFKIFWIDAVSST